MQLHDCLSDQRKKIGEIHGETQKERGKGIGEKDRDCQEEGVIEEKYKDCQEGKEKRGNEDEERRDRGGEVDELSTEYTSEGSEEFQDCDGEESEDWTSELDCGHRLGSTSLHCVEERNKIVMFEEYGREEEEKRERKNYWPETTAQERIELRNTCTCDHDQDWCDYARTLSCQITSCGDQCSSDACDCLAGFHAPSKSLIFPREVIISPLKSDIVHVDFQVSRDIVPSCQTEVASIVSRFIEKPSSHWPREDRRLIGRCSLNTKCSAFVGSLRPAMCFIACVFGFILASAIVKQCGSVPTQTIGIHLDDGLENTLSAPEGLRAPLYDSIYGVGVEHPLSSIGQDSRSRLPGTL